MRYEDVQKKKDDAESSPVIDPKMQNAPEKTTGREKSESPTTMEPDGEEAVDQFQVAVYNAGVKALSMLDANELTKGLEIDRRENVNEIIKQLGAFCYNIGFAGPQSCGKSSLINAIIRYPLMPTCILATTCTPVELIYGKEIRIIVKDEDREGKIIFDRKCGSISQSDFNKLVDYSCKVMRIAVIENLQFFCDSSTFDPAVSKNLRQHLHMDRSDLRQVALLFLILFTVYVHQNDKELDHAELEVNDLRLKTLTYFGIPRRALNCRVVVQWDNPMLASGLMITDLPGLGANAPDKKEDDVIIKGHDTITKEAVLRTDTMAFLGDPKVSGEALPALKAMVSNASIRDAVSVEERIVPIMNKADLLVGVQRETTINAFLSLMRNAGANMDNRKVWETSSFCGEYAYEGLDVKRSFYVQRELFHMMENGYSQDEIKDELPSILRKMKHGYERSGVNELREFFRSAFIGRGKYQKTFSAVTALRALALDMISPLRTTIDSSITLAEANGQFANEALTYLEEAATTPLASSYQNSDQTNAMAEEHMNIVDPMISAATLKYETALSEAVENYANRLMDIATEFDLTWIGLGNRARVDSGAPHNHELYQNLLDESTILKVDLAEVNKIHASALRYCSNATAGIYESARNKLVMFQKEYPRIMKDCVDAYREKAAPDVIALMEGLLPSLQQYVEAKIATADLAIQNQRANLQSLADRLAQEIVDLNGEFVSVLLGMVQGKLETVQGGWFTQKEFLVIDGADGLKATIRNLSLTEEDKKKIGGLITTKGSDTIMNKVREWYLTAVQDYNSIMTSLILEFVKQFEQMKKMLEQKNEGMESSIERDKETLEVLYEVFAQMQKDIQPQLEHMLELEKVQNSSLKGDMFEGMLKAQGDANG